MELKPWTVLSSKTVLKDKWIDVRADDCITAEGALIAPYAFLGPNFDDQLRDNFANINLIPARLIINLTRSFSWM